MATHPRTLAWKIPWTEEPGGLQSVEPQRAGHNSPHAGLGRVVFPSILWNRMQRIQQPLLVGTGGPCSESARSQPLDGQGVPSLEQIRFLLSVTCCLQGNKSGRGNEESRVCSRTLQSNKGERRV